MCFGWSRLSAESVRAFAPSRMGKRGRDSHGTIFAPDDHCRKALDNPKESLCAAERLLLHCHLPPLER